MPPTNLATLRPHEKEKLNKHTNGNFWYAPAAADGASIVLISSKPEVPIDPAYLGFARGPGKATAPNEVLGSYKIDAHGANRAVTLTLATRPGLVIDTAKLRENLIAAGGWPDFPTDVDLNGTRIPGNRDLARSKNRAQQMQNDVAMWTATFAKPGDPNLGGLLTRVFTIIYQGGLFLRTDSGTNTWATWASKGWPIASVFCHGGRVLVQLPDDEAQANAFWTWLKGNATPMTGITAAFSTHSIEKLATATPVVAGRTKRVKEVKTKASVMGQNRFNLAFGGAGNVHPYTGIAIARDGRHGHLLIVNLERALLIGCEASGPGAHDHFGKAHTADGSHGEFEMSGGLRWDNPAFVDSAGGPGTAMNPRKIYDTMFIDLSRAGEPQRVMQAAFAPTALGSPALPPRA